MRIGINKIKEVGYSEISLYPKKCIVDSRKECDTSVTLGNRKFDVPIYPSNMKSVINEKTCTFLAENNWFYTMHRFGEEIIPKEFIEKMIARNLFSSVSIGVNKESEKALYQTKDYLIDYITLDVANAWSDKAKRMADFAKKNHPKSFLIVGNVASPEAVEDIQRWKTVDAIKVGIAGGSVCITKTKTGFHRPMVSTVLDCYSVSEIPIIADGGIREHGDIAKALACGATMVMAGSLFAGYDESAGNIIEIEDKYYKEYFGSASKYNKEEIKNIEGKKILIPYRGPMKKLLKELKEDLQSSISYAGGNSLMHLNDDLIIFLGE